MNVPESQNGQNNSILYMWPAFWSTDTSQIYYSGINLFLFMMPGVSYLIYGCSSARTTPGVSLYWSLTLEENIVAVITQDRVIDNSLKRQIKNQTLCTCRLFALI